MEHELVVVLDFGGQYNQLIARRVRECNVYCEVHPYTIGVEKLRELKPAGIIFTGGPRSVYEEGAPRIGREIFDLGIPVLGICYGCHLMAHLLGGEVSSADIREYGLTNVDFVPDCPLFVGLPEQGATWMSHTDWVARLPEGFTVAAHSANCPVAAMECRERKLYALQFHPEVLHTQNGLEMIRSFLLKVCGCKQDWTMREYAQSTIAELKEKIGEKKVLLALSGGVDSSVLAALLSKAVGKQLTCVFVDTGMMRKNEGDEVEAAFAGFDVNFVRVNAGERFLGRLAGVEEPEQKRKIIGEEFIRVFEAEAKKIGAVDFLAQGTIYPDIIESGLGDAAVIKSHHNVGGLDRKSTRLNSSHS